MKIPQQVTEYSGKEEKLLQNSSIPQYFQYISNFRSPITCSFVKCVFFFFFFSLSFFLNSAYDEVRISESLLDFEITRVDYIILRVTLES